MPLSEVEVHALVRRRNTFRYGFQCVDAGSAQDILARTGRQLAMNPSLEDPQPL